MLLVLTNIFTFYPIEISIILIFTLAFSLSEENQLKKLLMLLNSNNLIGEAKNEKKIKIENWIKKDIELNHNHLRENSLRSIEASFKYFVEFFGNIFLDEITKERVIEFRSYLFSKINNLVYWRTLRASLNRAVEYGYLELNHFNSVKAPKQQKSKPKNIPFDDLVKIFPFVNSVLKELILFTYLTGLRLSEAVYLVWNDIDLQQKVIIIGSESFQTKTKNTRTIPLSNEAFNILQNRVPKILNVNQKNYVFVKSDNKTFTKDYVSKAFKKAVRKAGLSELYTFHGLRHSFASNLVNKGVSLYQVQKLLGHTNISTTQIYSHISLDAMRKAIDTLNNNYNKTNEI